MQTAGHTHEYYMQRALSLARRAEGLTSPNPAVGAVIIKDGVIIGEGYHHRAGQPHAEVEALRVAGNAAKDATMYVTLEPCNHHGRTPACTEAIISAEIARVVYAVGDPNPVVNGSGRDRLVAAGIDIHQGVCVDQAMHLNRFFFHHIRTGQPYVVAKFAMSLDGKIATYTGHSQWITGPEARQKGHELRHQVDAILVGAGTAIADNPRLTTRLPENHSYDNISHPLRIVLDSQGRVPLDAQLFQPSLSGKTLVATTDAMSTSHRNALHQQGVETIITTTTTKIKQVDLAELFMFLGERSIQSVMVEGGGQVLGSCFAAGLVNEVWAFVAPTIIGGENAPSPVGGSGFSSLTDAYQLQNTTIEQVGKDILIKGFTTT
ncbi:MAG: bifunctional diaminohydroxyphosphoribosylaminopyrimidine deaminase/5-amino-6-(5-phosphoribosylamino)uracil reductase RibD [Chloroflexota bacterium]